MTRFAWLQSRTQTLIAAVVLAGLVVAAAVTGIQLSHLYNSLVVHCQSGCDLATSQFVSHQAFLQRTLDVVAQVAPALIGIFWGAPLLAREFETGTYRLAWTQSVTRSRWLGTKLAVVGLATVILAGLLTLTITWWYRSIDHVSSNQYALFDRRDITPIGYAIFAFAAGALIGAVIRRNLPAMATTLGVYTLARIAIAAWVRPHLLSPISETMSLSDAGPSSSVHLGLGVSGNGGPVRLFADGEGPENSWTLSSHLLDSSGHPLSPTQISTFLHQYCPNAGTAPAPGTGGSAAAADAAHACLQRVADELRRAGHLPAGQPVLDVPVARNRHLHHPRTRRDRRVLLVDHPARKLTTTVPNDGSGRDRARCRSPERAQSAPCNSPLHPPPNSTMVTDAPARHSTARSPTPPAGRNARRLRAFDHRRIGRLGSLGWLSCPPGSAPGLTTCARTHTTSLVPLRPVLSPEWPPMHSTDRERPREVSWSSASEPSAQMRRISSALRWPASDTPSRANLFSRAPIPRSLCAAP